MRFKLILGLLLFQLAATAGDTIVCTGGNNDGGINVNGHQAFWCVFPGPYQESVTWNCSSSTWVGLSNVQCYFSGNYDYLDEEDINYGDLLTCTIYIPPGDTIVVMKMNEVDPIVDSIFYYPGKITEISASDICGIQSYVLYKINIQFFPDSLEAEYLHIRDSAEAVILNNDSIYHAHLVDSLERADSLATIQNIESGKEKIIYPNPTAGLVYISNVYNQTSSITIHVFDMQGNKVLDKEFSAGPGLRTNEIDLSSLAKGVYILQYLNNGNYLRQKIIKL
jgi:hypothetical protein